MSNNSCALQLKNITKTYGTGEFAVQALRGIDLNFRKNEFVSILGPSGCGKTTLLNIIGGLDRYTDGDLIINGKSTKIYGDRDWDVYRNHRIGFIFQSYNLIPHQNVLSNVELALTIAGIDKEERIKRAKEALDRVGLKGLYHKKPNQLSGGQCQRVAIARALVNNPEILLADEPTGALDVETSVQILELIKEISKERLVIMVTHNPELADKYSTRIVRMLDGKLLEDSMPLKDDEVTYDVAEDQHKDITKKDNKKKGKKKEKAKMSFFTAFKLSAKNLLTKKGRTALVGFAGSIGIIGIALVLAFSAGIKNYVASMQDDMLSGNPITITETAYDLDVLTGMVDNSQKIEIVKEPNRVYINSLIEYFITMGKTTDSMLIKNDLSKDYVDYVKAMPSDYYAAMIYDYGIDLHNNVYTTVLEEGKDTETEMSITALTDLYTDILKNSSFGEYAQYVDTFIPSFEQAPSSKDYIESQYNVYGKVATNKDEVMLVIDKQSEASDLLLARLGYYTQEELVNLIYKVDMDGKNVDDPNDSDYKYDSNLDVGYFSYEELVNENKTFYWYPNDRVYEKNMFNTYSYNYLADEEWKTDENAVELKVVGILQPKENISYGCLSSGIYYTEALTNHILQTSSSEQNGILNYYKNLDVSNYVGNSVYTIGSMIYSINYTYEGESKTAMSSFSLAGNSSGLASLFSAGNLSAEDMKNSVIRTLGGNDVSNDISIFPIDFDSKDLVTNYLKAWNEDGTITVNGVAIDNRNDVTYTDTLSLVINLINTMIDVVSYALIAFTSVSLVVSTVMIGVITYVSVVERIKEIGVIRSLGGSKKDVSHLFNAETFIIGLLAGLIGIGATLLISEIINVILFPLIGIRRIAMLPFTDALLMILLSIGLTLISGLIPARSAAKKDPVVALRTE